LQQNLWIDAKTDMMTLGEEVAVELDTVMTIRREGLEGARTPNGILTRLDGTLVGRILSAIESRAEAALVDLGFMLLTLGGETLDNLNRGLNEIAQLTTKDGRSHDFTISMDESDTGLTVHCSPLPNAEAAEKLLGHCRLRKYVHRVGSWFGLVVRADDGLPKFGLNLRFPWKQDNAMDEATTGMPGGRKPRRGEALFNPRKTGRNEPCPCGSGRKFKKCCMISTASGR
jgi:hypothetical protein